jgi:hypothetical protein
MIRLNHFLPFFRKRKRDEPPARPLPAFWAPLLSDRETGRRGWIRKALKNVGETWLSSPWRRVVQAGFFVGFVLLFVWVCWPYGGTDYDYARHREAKEKIAAEFLPRPRSAGESLDRNRVAELDRVAGRRRGSFWSSASSSRAVSADTCARWGR